MLSINLIGQSISNTLRLHANASAVCEIHNIAQLRAAIAYAHQKHWPWLVLGTASNVILPSWFHGIVMIMRIRGRQYETHRAGYLLRLGAGENWHRSLVWCAHNKLYGLENLSFIPGSVGAAPVQNIGAYGLEAAARIEFVEYYDVVRDCCNRVPAAACGFGYRRSYFKTRWHQERIITAVCFRLTANFSPQLHYPPLHARIGADVSAVQFIAAIGRLRRIRLPSIHRIGNVGSFFCNPLVNTRQLQRIQQNDNRCPAYPQPDGRYKLSAAWLIEACGWKGYRDRTIGIWPRHALVLTHRGDAQAHDILRFAARIQSSVYQRFAVTLDIEPTVIPTHKVV